MRKNLILISALLTLPVLALNTKPDDGKELAAKCESAGGCFVVTEEGFKKAMVMAFERGQQLGGQVGYQYGLKACKGDT